MLKVKNTLLIFSLMLTINNLSFSEGKILKNELPKNEREFFEGGRLIDLQDEIKESETNIDTSELPKFFVKTIILKTPTITIKPLVNPKKIDKILDEYKNKEINILDLRALVKKLNEEYANEGYITTRVYLEPDQNLQSSEIRLVALEGKIEEIILDKDTAKDKRRVFFAFTNEKDKILNISHIDNGIDNLNRVESNNSKINIVPGTKQGYSKVIVESEKEKPIRLVLNYEDTQKNKQKYKTTLEYDNLFGINDNLYFSYRGDVRKLTKDHKDDYTEAYSAGYSFPVKSWTLGFSFNRKIDKNTEEKILETQDRNITVASVGVNGLFKPFKGIMSYSLSYSKGIKGFHSKEDNPFNVGTMPTPSIEAADNRFEFGKVNLNLSYYKPFYFKNQGVIFRTMFNAQYTNDSLFSIEKYSIGDFSTVKGFPSTVSGDIGYNTKVELSYILSTDEGKMGKFLYKVRPYIEADLGKVRNNYNEEGEKRGKIATMSSYSVGIRYYGEKITLDTGISKIDSGRGLMKTDSHRGFATVSVTF